MSSDVFAYSQVNPGGKLIQGKKSISVEFNWLYSGELCVNYILAKELTDID